MILRENYFNALLINFLDLGSNVDKDGSIISTQIKKGNFNLIPEENGKNKKIN